MIQAIFINLSPLEKIVPGRNPVRVPGCLDGIPDTLRNAAAPINQGFLFRCVRMLFKGNPLTRPMDTAWVRKPLKRIPREHLILGAIFLLSLAFRLAFALQSPAFSPEGYFALRQVQHIRSTWLPLYEDPISYGGRILVFQPLFHYVLAAASLVFSPVIALQVLPNVLASSVVIVVYLLTFELSRSTEASLTAAFLSAFVPVYVAETLNSLSVHALMVPLLFLFIYLFIRVKKEHELATPLLVVLATAALLHPSAFLLVLGLVFYILLVSMERLERSRAELEVTLFAIVSVLWLYFILFKRILLFHGPSVVWQNIPLQVLSEHFSGFNLLGAVSLVGFLPFVFGSYAAYRFIVTERRRQVYLLTGFVLAVFLLLGMSLIPLSLGLIYLGMSLIPLFGLGYKLFLVELGNSKVERFSAWIRAGMLLLVVISSVLPSLGLAFEQLGKAPTREEFAAFSWLREHTPVGSTVLATLEEGHLITAMARRKNLIDGNFLMVDRPGQRLGGIERIYTTSSQTEALRLLQKYGVRYVLVSRAKGLYGIANIPSADDRCFPRVYPEQDTDGPFILERRCELEESA